MNLSITAAKIELHFSSVQICFVDSRGGGASEAVFIFFHDYKPVSSNNDVVRLRILRILSLREVLCHLKT